MRRTRIRVLMASSVHRWDDVRIYYKEALSLVKFADVSLIAVENRESSQVPDERLSVKLLPADGSLPGKGKSVSLRLKHMDMVMRAALRQKYDVFHFHDPELIPVAWFAKMRGKKVIYDMHEDALHLLTRRRWISKPLARIVGMIIRGLEKLSLMIFDKFILAEKAYAGMFTTKKCHTVLNYPRINQTFTPVRRRGDEPLRMVYMGVLSRARGAEDILSGIRDLRQSGMNITLDLYGTVTETESHEMIINGMDDGWLKFHGWVSGNNLPSEIHRYHVGLSPLRDHQGYLHIWPTKVLEYVASGLAVVGTSLPGVSRLMEEIECGVLYPPGDIESLKEAIITLNNEDTRFSLAEMGHNKINQYSWATQERALFQLYRDILG